MEYHFKIKKESKGYSAVCVELPGCVTQANSREELESSMKDALNLYLDEPSDSKLIFPLPKKKVLNAVSITVDSSIAFAFALRRARLKNKLTQTQAKDLIGITGSLNNYQRLENSRTANPVLDTLVRIKRAFPDFPIELVAS